MARYPTFEEYRKRGNFREGIKRCDDLLKKNPSDVQLLIVKLQLSYATGDGAEATLKQMSTLQPPVVDLREIAAIEDAVEYSQRDFYPQANTAGPIVASIWDNAFKTSNSMNHKLDVLSLRFSRALIYHRLIDAQQALIQLKALQPKNRTIYMAHVAITQLLSASNEDLQSRLALSLARKAVKDNFDEDKSLDCRVPGQVFAFQASEVDMQSIVGRRFADSKQVHDAYNRKDRETATVVDAPSIPDAATVPPAEWLSLEIQTLKQQFTRLIAALAPARDILAFAANSIRLFHVASTELTDHRGRGPADACFLSVSALVRAFEITDDRRHLLHAAYLAETLLKHNANVHEARMILVYLYMNLGLGSLAIRMFNSLNVKEIQHDTVGHALFTRLSVTHPQSTRVNKRDVYDPQKKLSHAVAVYTRHEEKLAETEASVLNHEQTGLLFDLRDLRNRLRSSVTRRIIHLEQRRIARLLHDSVGDEPGHMGPGVTANWLNVTDNRDFTAGFDFGYSVEKALHGLPGPLWIARALIADCAWCMARGAELPIKDPAMLVEEIAKMNLELSRLEIDDRPAERLTMAEMRTANVACEVLKMLLSASNEPLSLKGNIDAVEKTVEAWHVDSMIGNKTFFCEQLQESFVYIDSLRIVLSACKYTSQNSTEHQSELQHLRKLVAGQGGRLLRYAREQAQAVDAAGVQKYMEDDELTRETVKQFGEGPFREFCTSIASSAREGWEGLAMIKLD